MNELSTMDERTQLLEAVLGGLERITQIGGSDNRLVLQGDRGFIMVRGEQGEDDVKVLAAAGRVLDRTLEESEAQRLYEAGFRRKTAALCFKKEIYLEGQAERQTLSEELIDLCLSTYASGVDKLSVRERFGEAHSNANPRVIEAMKRLSKQRDMPSRQKVYWAIIRADVLLALSSPPPASLKSPNGRQQWIEAGLNDIKQISSSVNLKVFKEITGIGQCLYLPTLKLLI